MLLFERVWLGVVLKVVEQILELAPLLLDGGILAQALLERIAVLFDLAVPERLQPLQGPLAFLDDSHSGLGHEPREIGIIICSTFGIGDSFLPSVDHFVKRA